MVIADMIHSCSNANVAQAAVRRALGALFAERVAAVADAKRDECGSFRRDRDARFARRASDETLSALQPQNRRLDQPLLRGLVHVVEPALEEEALFFDDESRDHRSPVALSRGALY